MSQASKLEFLWNQIPHELSQISMTLNRANLAIQSMPVASRPAFVIPYLASMRTQLRQFRQQLNLWRQQNTLTVIDNITNQLIENDVQTHEVYESAMAQLNPDDDTSLWDQQDFILRSLPLALNVKTFRNRMFKLARQLAIKHDIHFNHELAILVSRLCDHCPAMGLDIYDINTHLGCTIAELESSTAPQSQQLLRLCDGLITLRNILKGEDS